MEDFMRPIRKEVPREIVHEDLVSLSQQSNADTLLISDALFKSFDLFSLFRSLNMKVDFETRCDVLDPSLIREIADVCGILALGLESASYSSLRRMNKVRDRAHYEKYISNAFEIFNEAVKNDVPVIIFMIAGYPGDTEADLEKSLNFAEKLSRRSGPGGHVFKIGECRVYPKTKTYNMALSLPDVIFEDAGVFEENVVRQPSRKLRFETVTAYMKEIFGFSNYTYRLRSAMLNIMPFFRLPAHALADDVIPDKCFNDPNRKVFNAKGKSLVIFNELVPSLNKKYRELMSGERSTRNLSL
jgi:radical SAM superfamily enzyme YgiQ (UPF0313 family)